MQEENILTPVKEEFFEEFSKLGFKNSILKIGKIVTRFPNHQKTYRW